jgi:hypothetical protein
MSKRYSEKEKMRLVSGCVESEESRASYARRHGVSVGSLARWEADLGSAKASETGMRFVEVELPANPAAGGQGSEGAGLVVAELVLPGGARVRFFSREGAC